MSGFEQQGKTRPVTAASASRSLPVVPEWALWFQRGAKPPWRRSNRLSVGLLLSLPKKTRSTSKSGLFTGGPQGREGNRRGTGSSLIQCQHGKILSHRAGVSADPWTRGRKTPRFPPRTILQAALPCVAVMKSADLRESTIDPSSGG